MPNCWNTDFHEENVFVDFQKMVALNIKKVVDGVTRVMNLV